MKGVWVNGVVIMLLLGVSMSLGATSLNTTIPNPFGVNIHFTNAPPGSLELLSAGGWKHIRMDFFWAAIETSPHVYNFKNYDILIESLTAHNITPIFILDYSNPLYNKGLPPSDDISRQAFSNFTTAALRHFRNRSILWELWNEPDLSYSWPNPNPLHYALLATTVGKAIRSDPLIAKEIFMGPAISGFHYDYFETVMQGGVLSYFDYISIHGYTAAPPEAWVTSHDKLQAIIKKYDPIGKNTKVICSEWGHADTEPGFNKQIQAQWLVRQYLATLATSAPVAIWYDWIDDGVDPNNIQDHFGTVLHQYYPNRNPVYDRKPSYYAAFTFMRILSGKELKLVVENNNGGSFVYYFNAVEKESVGMAVFVVWTMKETVEKVVFTVPGSLFKANQCFDVVSIYGAKVEEVCASGRTVSVNVTGYPSYLIPNNK